VARSSAGLGPRARAIPGPGPPLKNHLVGMQQAEGRPGRAPPRDPFGRAAGIRVHLGHVLPPSPRSGPPSFMTRSAISSISIALLTGVLVEQQVELIERGARHLPSGASYTGRGASIVSAQQLVQVGNASPGRRPLGQGRIGIGITVPNAWESRGARCPGQWTAVGTGFVGAGRRVMGFLQIGVGDNKQSAQARTPPGTG